MQHQSSAPSAHHESLPQQAQERLTRGLLLYNRERRRIHEIAPDVWAVPSSLGGFWRVDLAAEVCPCPDFLYRCTDQDTGRVLMNCKHITAAAIKRAKQPRASVAGDHPHACLDGWVFLGYTDDEGGEQIEAALPPLQGGPLMCRKYQRHCPELERRVDEAVRRWARAETYEAVHLAWSALGGQTTLHRYGREHFRLLARHRHGDPEALPLLVARMQSRGYKPRRQVRR
jgi:hypothetical protein